MLTLEIILLLASSGYILCRRLADNHLNKVQITGLLVLVLLLHLTLDGYRWQMIPSYLLWTIAVITALVRAGKSSSVIIRILRVTGLAILVIPAVALPSFLPVFDLPRPSGSYSVGSRDLLLTTDRDEVITSDPSDKRRVMIKVWYPTTETSPEMDPYIDQAGRYGFAGKYGLPSSAFNYLDKVETHTFRNVPLAGESFPVLIFSHGYNSKANGYYALLSEITSHGYIVFAINHTYESTGSTFPDGTMKYFDYAYASSIEAGTWESIAPVKEAFEKGLSYEERHPTVRKALTSYFVKGIVERWAKDISDVVGALEDWNNDDFFSGRMDLTRVGVFGHSRGGGAAGHALLTDPRIKAGANIDGVQWGSIVDTVFQKPFLFLSADWPEDHEDLNSHAYINKSTSYFYQGMLHESAHSNFMDIPLMVTLPALSQAGSINPGSAIDITNKTIIRFFDKHLNNKMIDITSLSNEHDMLELEVFAGDSVTTSTHLSGASR